MQKINQQLKEMYLEELDPSELNQLFSDQGYSHCFLPLLPNDFSLNCKIMVIGSETRGWGKKAKWNGDIKDYVNNLTDLSSNYYSKCLNGLKDIGPFMMQLRKIKNITGHAPFWANLFICDYKKKSPIKSEFFNPIISPLSKKILLRQIGIIDPELIIFCNTREAITVRRNFFPIDECETINNMEREGVFFWEFDSPMINSKRYRCIRTCHPAVRKTPRNIKNVKGLDKLNALLLERFHA